MSWAEEQTGRAIKSYSNDPYILRYDILLLNSKKVTERRETPWEETRKYNCWGFTIGLFEPQTGYRWIRTHEQMENWLRVNTEPVNGEIQCGDIAVFRAYYESYDTEKDELTHTAVVVDPTDYIIIHKPGGLPLERLNAGDAAEIYGETYGRITEYRRYKGGS